MIQLKDEIKKIINEKNVSYAPCIRTKGCTIYVDIKFKDQEAADQFCFAWAFNIYQRWDDDFYIKLRYLYKAEFQEQTIHFEKAGKAPALEEPKFYQRPERRLSIF